MAKRRKRRSAIVPAVVLSMSLVGGAGAIPALVTGCNSGNAVPQQTVAADAFQPNVTNFDLGVADLGFSVAADGFQMVGVADLGFSVAVIGFDMSEEG